MNQTQAFAALPVRRTALVSAYFANPFDAYLQKRRFLCASPGGDVFTLFAWGKLGADDARELLEVLDASTVSEHTRRRQLVDLRAVEGVSPAAMQTLVSYYGRARDYLSTVAAEAVVRPDGLVGILAEGFYPAVPLPFRKAVFRSASDALEWLGVPLEQGEPWIVQVLARVNESAAMLRAGLEGLSETILRLGAGATLSQVAKHQGTSARSLQRMLGHAETSFRREKARVLTRAAMERIGNGSVVLKTLAHDLGYASEARFSEQFRREIGESPSSYRARLRAAQR